MLKKVESNQFPFFCSNEIMKSTMKLRQEVFWSIIKHGGMATDEEVLPVEVRGHSRTKTKTQQEKKMKRRRIYRFMMIIMMIYDDYDDYYDLY